MTQRWFSTFLGLSGLLALSLAALPSHAQSVQPKAPMYSYVANWQVPRAHWGDVAQSNAATKTVLDKAIADGTLVGYGADENVVHTPDGETHDSWWSSMSMAGILKAREQLFSAGVPNSPALDTATKHWDNVYVSRYYNWHSGSFKGAYTEASTYQLKSDAPADAVDVLAQNIIVPALEKLLADGALLEYEIDQSEIHTEAPGTFTIVSISAGPDGIDKLDAAIADSVKSHPLISPAFTSMTKASGHRDELLSSEGAWK